MPAPVHMWRSSVQWVKRSIALNEVADNFSFEFNAREGEKVGFCREVFYKVVPGENGLVFYGVSTIADGVDVRGPDLSLKGTSGTMVVYFGC